MAGRGDGGVVLATTWDAVRGWRAGRGLVRAVGQPGVTEVVRRLCGVQAQVPGSAARAIGVRQAEPVAGAMDEALRSGELVRTWTVRGTLHLVTPDDAGAYLALMAAGRVWEKGSWVRTFGVTPEEMVRLTEAIAEILEDGPLTREQLVAALAERVGGDELAAELRSGWGAVLKPVAWQGVLCHGPPDGNRVTFARPDRLLPAWAGLPEPDEAARVVIPAYLRTYGPATADRFDAWLTRGVSRKGLLRGWFAAVADRLVTVDVEGTVAYLLADDVDELAGTPIPSPEEAAAMWLLPAFDQHVLGPGTAATEIIRPDRRKEISRAAGWIAPVVVAGGRVVGVWEVGEDKTPAEVRLFGDADGDGDGSVEVESAALDAAVERMRTVLAAVAS